MLGRQLLVLKAGTVAEIDTAFATLVEQRANAVIIAGDPFLSTRTRQFAVLAARHGLPMISLTREYPLAGGLISYGNSVTDAYRRAGILTGRLLKGAKPADMPIDRATKFELVINLGTAKALGLDVPPSVARPRRRGDRMRGADVGYWHKADIAAYRLMSAIGGKADIQSCSARCPLMTQSGHRLPQRASLKSISLRDNCPSKLFLCTWSFRLSPPR